MQRFSMMRCCTLSAAVVLVALAGCGSGGEVVPKTYPVTGKVYDASGKPMSGGEVRFRHPTDTTTTIQSEIKADGSYALRTITGKRTLEGAPEGEYEVNVTPAIPQGQHGLPPLPNFPGKYRVEAKPNTIDLRAAQ